MGRDEYSIYDAFNKAYALTDYKVHNNLDERYKFRRKTIDEDELLNDSERKEAIEILDKRYQYDKIISNEGAKRVCENCQQKCLAILYCELCIRNHLKAKFSEWTSGNKHIDNLIQKCQMESIGPNKIIEWINVESFRDFKYITKGGFSEIYLTDWIDGHYHEWDSDKQELIRCGPEKVILKKLEDVESADRSWFEEAKSHLTISNKWAGIIQCYGLTQCPIDNKYVLVMKSVDMDLRKYLRQNHNNGTWKKRIKINVDIIDALLRIHKEEAIHRDLHSGNILYSKSDDYWYISDLGFCGPADKPLDSIYGNLPYIAPEVIDGKEYTKASDIYSIAMLMWEISSGRPPFIGFRHDDYELAIKIINGFRPKIVPGTPSEYKKLMEECWDADPSKRPNTDELWERITSINRSYQSRHHYENDKRKLNNNLQLSSNIDNLSISKVYSFNNLSEPRNATEEQQEAYHEEEEIYNNPNLHPEDQDKLEIPEGNYLVIN